MTLLAKVHPPTIARTGRRPSPDKPARQTPSGENDRLEEEARRTANKISAGSTAIRDVRENDLLPSGARRTKTATHSAHGPGRPLEPMLQQEMSQHFGHDFSRVRIHDDHTAAVAASAEQSRAYTLGNDVVFSQGAYAPRSPAGKRLLAHELAHVVQQNGVATGGPVRLRTGGPIIQRDRETSAAGAGEPGVLTIVIRAPDDKFTRNVTDYVRNTLNDPNVVEVDNLQEAAAHIGKLRQAKGRKLKKVRLVAHGSTAGGIKMKPPGSDKRVFVSPTELAKIAEDSKLQAIAADAMEDDATVEFYGCYVGREPTTQAAISTMFQSRFLSPDEALHTEDFDFLWNKKPITSSGSVDELAKKDKKVRPQFEAWLLQRHKELVAAGDLPDVPTRAEKIAAMRELFDRSKGSIKQLVIEKKGGAKVRRSEKAAWDSEWRKWSSE